MLFRLLSMKLFISFTVILLSTKHRTYFKKPGHCFVFCRTSFYKHANYFLRLLKYKKIICSFTMSFTEPKHTEHLWDILLRKNLLLQINVGKTDVLYFLRNYPHLQITMEICVIFIFSIYGNFIWLSTEHLKISILIWKKIIFRAEFRM